MTITVETLTGHETEWIGWKSGKPTGFYSDRWAVDRALARRVIDSGSPVADMIRNLAVRAARELRTVTWRGTVIPVEESDVRPDDTRPESPAVMRAWAQLARELCHD